MTTSARQLTGTSAKCHSIGTRWVCMAAWALESTIHDTGAEDALCQHRGQQRQQRNRHRAELQKRLLVFHKIEVQYLRDGDGAHSVIADADAAGDSLGHAGESLGGGAEILHLLPEPQPQCGPASGGRRAGFGQRKGIA